MVNSSKAVIFTKTDRVDKLMQQKKAVERTSSATLSTATMSTSSLEDPVVSKSNIAAGLCMKGKEDLLMRLIAKEMAASLLNSYKSGGGVAPTQDDGMPSNHNIDDNDEQSECSSVGASVQSELAKLNLNVDSLAKMILSQAANNGQNNELSHGYLEEDGHSFCDQVSRGAVSRSASSMSSGAMSQLSNQTGGNETPLDIWHPDFWTQDDDVVAAAVADVPVNDKLSAIALRSVTMESAGASSASSGTGGADAKTNNSGKALHEFIQNLKEISGGSSDSSDNCDDCSVLSDISGLTGVFSDFPEGRKTKKAAAAADKKEDDCQHTAAMTESSQGTRSKVSGTSIATKKSQSSLSKAGSKQSFAGTGSLSRRSGARKPKKVVSYSVQFSTVQVRYYERILSDNPSSNNGPSVGIGWNYDEKKAKQMDDWEFERAGRLRSPSELVLSRRQREKLLEQMGYTTKDIADSVRQLNKARYQRRQTVNNLGAQKMEEAMEAAKKKMKKLLFLQRSSTSSLELQPERIQI